MKKITSKNCIRCGSPKGEYPNECNSWGTYYGRHIFTYMEAETRDEKKIEELSFRLALKK